MDKKTLTGFLLMGAIMIGFFYLNQPSKEQLEAQQRYNDSIQLVKAQLELEQRQLEMQLRNEGSPVSIESLPDSLKNERLEDEFGAFAVSAEGDESFVTLENELVELKFSTLGGRLCSARLKNYQAYDSLPLILFDEKESNFGLTLVTRNNRVVNTGDLYFEPIEKNDGSLVMRLHSGSEGYMDFAYSLLPSDYMLRFEITHQGMEQVLSSNTNALDINWRQKIRQQEAGRTFEERYARAVYKFEAADDVEETSEGKDEIATLSNRLKWVAYKNQFFSSVLIADGSLEATKIDSKHLTSGKYMKDITTTTSVLFDMKSTDPVGFHFYLGPNDYKLLKDYDKKQFQSENLQLERLVPLGWSLFRYVNKWIMIPLFDWLTDSVGNLGLAIFLLTLIIKMGLFPLTYKSFMSSAKMRVMRPQVEELNAKYPDQEDAMKRQQKVMELYRQAGVNPMSGCLPMVLQMPFLIALFMFFPAAIQLRHESFLWAPDLSTYDAIISWNTYIPLVTPYFGNHVSLFCLLMTITQVIYTKFNMDQNNTGQQQMPGMKMMMYIMPVFMLVFLNSYPAGLNYYYFISTLITILQTIAFRMFVDEKKILTQLELNKKKPQKKKSGFMARLEEAQRQQQEMARKKAQQKKR